jgi:hypothetical protein
MPVRRALKRSVVEPVLTDRNFGTRCRASATNGTVTFPFQRIDDYSLGKGLKDFGHDIHIGVGQSRPGEG